MGLLTRSVEIVGLNGDAYYLPTPASTKITTKKSGTFPDYRPFLTYWKSEELPMGSDTTECLLHSNGVLNGCRTSD